MLKFISFFTKWQVVLALQMIASGLFVALVYNLGAMPSQYMIAVLAVFLVLCLGTMFLMKPTKSNKEKKNGKIRQAIGKLISCFLSAVLMIGSLYIVQGTDVLGKITSATEQITRFSVYTLNDGEFNELDDLTFSTVGMSPEFDKEEHMTEAHNALINENTNIDIVEYKNYIDLVEALYNKEIQAIYVNEAYVGMFEDTYSTFASDVMSIWSYEITEQIIDISKKVDVTNSVFTLYISGIDTQGKVSTVSRSDVNMLVTVNPNTKEILMISIPRDYYVTLTNKGMEDKLTHAGLGGVENSVSTIENFMGIDINYYARVNFTSLVKIVDALGGITVESPYSFITRHRNYQIVAGENQMDGDKALGFVRERYALPNGDNDRVQNQQRVLKAMLNKAMSPAIITNYSSILKAIDGSFETNMKSDEIMSLIQMQLNDMATWTFHSYALKGTGQTMTGGAYMPGYALYYMIPDQESIKYATSLIKDMANGKSITVE